MVAIEFSSKITNVNDKQLLRENTATCFYVDDSIAVSAEDERCKTSSIKENVASTTMDKISPVELLYEHSNDPILSMRKLEDIENFMDTLLDSKLEEDSLNDTSHGVPHETELSTAKPLSDVQLMNELHRLNEISSTSNHGDNDANKTINNEEMRNESSSILLDPCKGNNYLVCIRN